MLKIEGKEVVFSGFTVFEDGEGRDISLDEIIELQKEGYVMKVELVKPEKVKELFFRILKGKYDIVIGTSPPLTHNFFALKAAKLSGAKFILDAKDDGYFLSNLDMKKRSFKFRIYSLLRSLTYNFRI